MTEEKPFEPQKIVEPGHDLPWHTEACFSSKVIDCNGVTDKRKCLKCDNKKYPWNGTDLNIFNCRGMGYLIQRTEDCKDFISMFPCLNGHCSYWYESPKNNNCEQGVKTFMGCTSYYTYPSPEKQKIEEKEEPKPKTTNPLQYMELE